MNREQLCLCRVEVAQNCSCFFLSYLSVTLQTGLTGRYGDVLQSIYGSD